MLDDLRARGVKFHSLTEAKGMRQKPWCSISSVITSFIICPLLDLIGVAAVVDGMQYNSMAGHIIPEAIHPVANPPLTDGNVRQFLDRIPPREVQGIAFQCRKE